MISQIVHIPESMVPTPIMNINIRQPTPGPETAGRTFLPSSAPETQSPIDELANSLHLALGVSKPHHSDTSNPSRPRASSTSVITDPIAFTPASARHHGPISHSLDETRSGTRSPFSAGSVFSASTNDNDEDHEEGPSPRSVQSLPLPQHSQTPFYRFIRRLSNSSVNAPTYLDLSPDDPLYWVLSAGLTRARDSDLTELEFAKGPPPYLMRQVPHTVYDERKRSGLRITVDVTRVINGTWYGRKAVYVGLQVAHTERKVPSTKIRVDVATGGLGDIDADTFFADPSAHQPVIVRIAPKKHYGSANPVDQSTEVGLEGRIAPPSPAGNTGITANINRTSNITLEKRQVITAWTSSEAR